MINKSKHITTIIYDAQWSTWFIFCTKCRKILYICDDHVEAIEMMEKHNKKRCLK